ncbi:MULTISPECIES: hypothetical protein [unclassified Variovorax]|uniref:hypothetical protein n=1 Tax=unclassified Variovorax TaxID=663243 RepID=UPI003ECEFD8B
MPQQHFNRPAAAGGSHLNHNLMLVQFLPPGGEPRVGAALWREGDRVHLAAPLMRARNGVRDPKSFARQFPDALASIDAFEEAMTCLDAACYAAADPHEVDTACQLYPEWRLQCLRYDGSDSSLLGLASLIRAAGTTGSFPKLIMRDCLLEIVRQILKNAPELAAVQIESTSQEGDDVATLDLGLDGPVVVTLLTNIASTDVVRQGVLAHHRMTDPNSAHVQCLLVVPNLQISQPTFLTPRVVIANMDTEHIRASLVHMAKR